jgi:hypothetical protein
VLLPFSIKIGAVAVELLGEGTKSNHLLDADSKDLEYIEMCWNELKSVMDKRLQEELYKLKSNRTQGAKSRLAIEILHALGSHAVDEKIFKGELIKTGKFSKEEADDFLKIAVTDGLLFANENGYYARNWKLRISSLKIKNFKNISYLELGDLQNVVVIAGENGAGKSSTLMAIDFVKDVLYHRRREYQCKDGEIIRDQQKRMEI